MASDYIARGSFVNEQLGDEPGYPVWHVTGASEQLGIYGDDCGRDHCVYSHEETKSQVNL